MFVDRRAELKALESQYERTGSNLVVVYGRRRLGKTTLLREFVNDVPSVYFLASEESEQENRKAFQRSVADFTGNSLLRAAAVDS